MSWNYSKEKDYIESLPQFEAVCLRITRILENAESLEDFKYLWWTIQNYTPMIYWLFHIPLVRNRIHRLHWHHWLGKYYSFSWKWR